MIEAWRIKDWSQTFETADARRTRGPLTKIALPARRDGADLRRVMTSQHGAALYGTWVMLLIVAAESPRRGYLLSRSKGKPLSLNDLHWLTDIPEHTLETALQLFLDVGWIEKVDLEADPLGCRPDDFVHEAFVYFILNTGTDCVKIGYSKNVQARLAGLQTASPHSLELLLSIPGGKAEERELQERFREYRVHGEWFSHKGDLAAFIAKGASDGR